MGEVVVVLDPLDDDGRRGREGAHLDRQGGERRAPTGVEHDLDVVGERQGGQAVLLALDVVDGDAAALRAQGREPGEHLLVDLDVLGELELHRLRGDDQRELTGDERARVRLTKIGRPSPMVQHRSHRGRR